MSRRLVFAAYRDGGQRQFVERPVPAVVEQPLTATLAWAQSRLEEPLPVAELARHAHVSVTTLHRRFRAELGTTPLGWLTGERVELARRLLEQGTGLDAVAHRSGLGTTADLRAQLRRHTGLGPSEYRARFTGWGQPSPLSTQHSPRCRRSQPQGPRRSTGSSHALHLRATSPAVVHGRTCQPWRLLARRCVHPKCIGSPPDVQEHPLGSVRGGRETAVLVEARR